MHSGEDCSSGGWGGVDMVLDLQKKIKAEVDIYVIRGWNNAPVRNYSTVTL
jgi:hypothetical protein